MRRWPLTLSDPVDRSRVLARRSVRQAAFSASGLVKGDHIVDPRTGDPARGRRAAWVAVPRPPAAGSSARGGERPRAAAVADGLTTAFMLMGLGEIEALCEQNPGLEAWVLPEPADGETGEASLVHVGGPGSGYTSASSAV